MNVGNTKWWQVEIPRIDASCDEIDTKKTLNTEGF